jgi:hypothetical protein
MIQIINLLPLSSFQELCSRQKNDGLLNYVKVYCGHDDNNIINESKVTEAIQNLKCHKSCGPDGIPAEALKYGGTTVGSPFNHVIQQVLVSLPFTQRSASNNYRASFEK